MAKTHVAALAQSPAYAARTVVVIHNQPFCVGTNDALTDSADNRNDGFLVRTYSSNLAVQFAVLTAAGPTPTVEPRHGFLVGRKVFQRLWLLVPALTARLI
jgi:hypothetical protein